MPAVIETAGLVKTFGAARALDGLDLTVRFVAPALVVSAAAALDPERDRLRWPASSGQPPSTASPSSTTR